MLKCILIPQLVVPKLLCGGEDSLIREIRGASLVEKVGHNVILFMQLSAELVVLASALMQPQFAPGASYTLWGDGTRVCLLFKNRSQPCHRKH